MLVAVISLVLGLAATAGGAARSHAPRKSDPTIVIGSVNFTEANIVADLYGDVLRHATKKVEEPPKTRRR